MFSSGLAMESMKSCFYIVSGFTGRFSSQLMLQGVYAPVNLCVCMCVFACKRERHRHRNRDTKLIYIYPKACYAFLSYLFGEKHHKVLKYISI